MTTTEMLDLLKSRTKIGDQTKLLNELRSAYRWVGRRVYNSADGPDLLSTLGEELAALAAVTRTIDLAAEVEGMFLGLKQLWVKLPNDLRFTPMVPRDSNDPQFAIWDSEPAATATAAFTHPIYYHVLNFSEVRFAPALPVGAVIRVDYFKFGLVPDPDDSSSEPTGSEIPEVFQDAALHKAASQLFSGLDDSREITEELRARQVVDDAIYAAGKRTQSPTRTQPYRRHGRR